MVKLLKGISLQKNKWMKLISFIVSILLLQTISAQDDWRLYSDGSNKEVDEKRVEESKEVDSLITEGELTIYSDPRIDSLIASLDASPPSIKGYRVELFFGKRKDAENVKSEFLKFYDEWPIYVVWHQPNFKVQIGNFMTKLQAEKAQHGIRSHYPNSYITITEIKQME